jgi:DNA polymerase III psi subunit
VAENQASEKQLRDHYLQTLGIVQYVSKEHADEVVVDNPDDPVAESPKIENTNEKPSVSGVTQQSAIESILQVKTEEKSNKSATKEAKPSAELPQNTTPLALRFVFWQPTDELLIATAAEDQLPDHQHIKLLTKIVAAIDSQVSKLPQFDVVNWPPHASMQGGEKEAKEFLSTLVSSKLAAKSTKLLLILGDSAENWLFAANQKKAVKDGLLSISPEVTALIVPTLEEIHSQSQSKRDTWQTICRYFDQKKASTNI